MPAPAWLPYEEKSRNVPGAPQCQPSQACKYLQYMSSLAPVLNVAPCAPLLSLLPCQVVILDEAHERSLNTDILFGVVKQLVARRSAGCTYITHMVLLPALRPVSLCMPVTTQQLLSLRAHIPSSPCLPGPHAGSPP
jgi:hypothetical protein